MENPNHALFMLLVRMVLDNADASGKVSYDFIRDRTDFVGYGDCLRDLVCSEVAGHGVKIIGRPRPSFRLRMLLADPASAACTGIRLGEWRSPHMLRHSVHTQRPSAVFVA